MSKMVTTLVYITKKQKAWLREQKEEWGSSEGANVRAGLDHLMKESEKKK